MDMFQRTSANWRDQRVGDGAVHAVLYARVSSKDQEREGFSIPAQQTLLRQYAQQKGITIDVEFVDVETAKETGRPGFAATLAHLKQRRASCRTLLVEKTDRLYRNLKDYVLVDDLDVEIHFVKENVILTRNSRSSDKLLHGIRVVLAKNYIDNLSEEVRKGLRTKASQGLYPSFAPPGYVNTVGTDGRRVIVPDPVLGPVVTRLFEWFATGQYSLKTLARKAHEEGFRFRKSGQRVPISTLHKILRKRIYIGEFDYGGVRYEGAHEPLVSREVWERVQAILDGRQEKKHRRAKHDFAFSGIITCGNCGSSLVAEMKKHKYVYYHCTRWKGDCRDPYAREEVLCDQFSGMLRELVIPKEVLKWLQEEVVQSDLTERAAMEQATRRAQADLERLEARLAVLYEDRLDGRIAPEFFDQKAAEVREQQERLRHQLAEYREAQLAPAREALDLMGLTSRACELFLEQPSVEQRKLVGLITQKATWQDGELRMQFREPFEQLRLSNSATQTNESPVGGGGALFEIWR